MEDFGVPENYQELLTEAQNQASPAVIASEPREPAPEAIQDAPASAAAEPAPKRRRVSKAIQDAPTTAAETKSLNPDLKKQLTDILSSAKPMENLFENLRPLCVGVMNWLFDHYKAKAIASAKNLAEKGGDSTAEEQDAHGGLVALLDLLSKRDFRALKDDQPKRQRIPEENLTAAARAAGFQTNQTRLVAILRLAGHLRGVPDAADLGNACKSTLSYATSEENLQAAGRHYSQSKPNLQNALKWLLNNAATKAIVARHLKPVLYWAEAVVQVLLPCAGSTPGEWFVPALEMLEPYSRTDTLASESTAAPADERELFEPTFSQLPGPRPTDPPTTHNGLPQGINVAQLAAPPPRSENALVSLQLTPNASKKRPRAETDSATATQRHTTLSPAEYNTEKRTEEPAAKRQRVFTQNTDFTEPSAHTAAPTAAHTATLTAAPTSTPALTSAPTLPLTLKITDAATWDGSFHISAPTAALTAASAPALTSAPAHTSAPAAALTPTLTPTNTDFVLWGILDPAESFGILDPAESFGILDPAESFGILDPADLFGILDPAESFVLDDSLH
eukprot:TRINITY_DN5753_c0_g1_i5.p1 TRINITY_DN5753_c0_g1~~TRINITY_DN5753_c0_g1_i5.p1  ORF type:complete len:638 (+),score=137.47 TRINITY_DN5753_c0_g1_i5:223-1914(+)